MRIIVSTLEGKCLNSLRDDPDRKSDEKKSIELSVDPLVKSIRKNIVCKILAEYNKRLDDEQVSLQKNVEVQKRIKKGLTLKKIMAKKGRING